MRETKKNYSNDKNYNNGRENHFYGSKKTSNPAKDRNLSKKRSLGSGKILVRPVSRSNSKRNEDSLEKEEQQAKMMNPDLIAKMMKQSQTPNYMNKLKMKNKEINEKKKPQAKNKMLNLDM